MKGLVLGVALCLAAVSSQAASSLEDRQAQARRDKADLRAEIQAVQKQITASEKAKKDIRDKLQATEQAISDITRQLAGLDQRRRALTRSLDELADAQSHQQAALETQQDALAAQLRAQYAAGLSPWTALLSGKDPQWVGRELAYLAHLSQARTQTLEELRSTLKRLAKLKADTEQGRRDLDAVLADTRERNEALEAEKKKHTQVLASVQAELQKEHGQAKDLAARDAKLSTLIDDLGAAIERAEAKRKAEAARRARERAKREQERREQAAREQAEREARAKRDRAAQAEQEKRAQAPRTESPAGGQPAREAPEGGFAGLRKPLPLPVDGTMQGRFGAQRPEGGIWRGVVLRAPEGTPVHAVAAGRVVYTHWLSGFGNLMIVDHGHQYLSIYAYNQALLKQVGDIVAQGDVIARVGATGGQVEPGLYFELRHDGAPINPQLWLKP